MAACVLCECVCDLRVDIPDIDPSLMVEQYLISRSERVNAHIELVALCMRVERLDEEVIQHARHDFDLHLLVTTILDPLGGFVPCGVELHQSSLSSSLDELIRLGDQLVREQPRVRLGQLAQNNGGGDLSEVLEAEASTHKRNNTSSRQHRTT